jgi:hypothetical protein
MHCKTCFRFKFLRAVIMNCTALWVVTPCSLEIARPLATVYCLHLQDRLLNRGRNWQKLTSACLLFLHVSSLKLETLCSSETSGSFPIIRQYKAEGPVTVAERSKAWTVFARLETRIVSSNPSQDMDVCVRFSTGRGLATSWSPAQGVLPNV